MAENKTTHQVKSIFVHPPSDEEHREQILQLAGNDPRRRAAILHWDDLDIVGLALGYRDCFDSLEFEDLHLEREDLEPITLFPELEELSFRNSQLKPELLPLITGLPNLWLFRYTGDRKMGNAICEVASSFPNLKVLFLEGKGIDDVGLSQIGKLKNLSNLYILNGKFTKTGIQSLQETENFIRIDFISCKFIDDECLKVLSGFKKIECLGVAGSKVTDAGILHLKPLVNLMLINLDDTAITDQAVATLASFANLHSVSLGNTQITNKAIQLLQNEHRLYRLHIPNTQIDDGAVPYLQTMTQLTEVDFRGTNISAEGIRKVQAKLKYRIKNDHGSFPTRIELEQAE